LLAYGCHVDKYYIDPKGGRSFLGLHEEKQELFIAMRKLKEPARSLAMQQATDKFTELGKVFYYQNGFFAPSSSRKSCTLYEIAKEKNKLRPFSIEAIKKSSVSSDENLSTPLIKHSKLPINQFEQNPTSVLDEDFNSSSLLLSLETSNFSL
jgi:hypothetical protein